MCSCMPAFKPLFAFVLPKLGVYSLTRKRTRSTFIQSPEHVDEGFLLEVGAHRDLETRSNLHGGHLSPTMSMKH